MKRFLALTMASAMVMSMAAAVVAATPTYTVGGIDNTAYAYNKDSGTINMGSPNPEFSYGDTAYYPLLSNKGMSSAAAVEAAKAALKTAQENATAAETAITTAKGVAEKAATVLATAQAWKTAVDAGAIDTIALEAAYAAALSAYSEALTPDADADTAVSNSDALLNTANAAITNAEAAKTAADLVVTEKQEALNKLLGENFGYVYEYDAVKGIKIKQDWDMNGKLIGGVDIVKKKASGVSLSQSYIYFVAVAIKPSTSTATADINGKISMRKSGEFDYADRQLEVVLEVRYPEATNGTITDKDQLFSEGNGFAGDVEDELRFEVDPDSYFTVNTTGQGKLVVSMNTRFNHDIAARFPEANLDFMNGNGATFNKTGVMTLSAAKDAHIYKLNSDGSLTLVKSTYDEYEEAHSFKTRSLDSYIISDVQLKNTGTVTTPDDNTNNGGNNSGSGNGSNPNTGVSL